MGLGALGVPAERGAIYDIALTHRSFAFEQAEAAPHNERLEFLGDAILGAVVTDLIYRAHPTLEEGEMARLRASVVNTHALAEIARALRLGDHLNLGKGESASGGRGKDSLLADALEAVIGAVYLDRGLATVTEHLVRIFEPRLAESLKDRGGFDAKTALQEIVVRAHGRFPDYRLTSSGPDHDKEFVAEVFIGGALHGTGSGRSKKEAEQNAAREALERLTREEALVADPKGTDARAS